MTTAPPAPGLAARILDALPPQTQCRRCGYAGLRGLCPGRGTRCWPASTNAHPVALEGTALSFATDRTSGRPLDATFGTEGPRGVAIIDEAWCIRCTLCLEACPRGRHHRHPGACIQ